MDTRELRLADLTNVQARQLGLMPELPVREPVHEDYILAQSSSFSIGSDDSDGTVSLTRLSDEARLHDLRPSRVKALTDQAPVSHTVLRGGVKPNSRKSYMRKATHTLTEQQAWQSNGYRDVPRAGAPVTDAERDHAEARGQYRNLDGELGDVEQAYARYAAPKPAPKPAGKARPARMDEPKPEPTMPDAIQARLDAMFARFDLDD